MMKANEEREPRFDENSAHIHLSTLHMAHPWEDEDTIKQLLLRNAERHIDMHIRPGRPHINVRHGHVTYSPEQILESGEQIREVWLTTYISILS